jgi:hypothetical protein
MNKINRIRIIFILSSLLFAALLWSVIRRFLSVREFLEPNKSREIVISRYNEDLQWITQDPFNKYDVIIYNKGDNDNFAKPANVKRVVPLKNVGRESHTYLQHIIQNYNNLSDITIFLPGSNQIQHKMNKSLNLIQNMEKSGNATFIAHETHENIKSALYDLKMDTYQSTSSENKTANPESKLNESPIRPYGRWFESTFGEIVVSSISYFGVFSVAKNDILQHPLGYYEKLEAQLSTSSNPEVGHYFERSWAAVFHPMQNTNIITE